MYNRYVPLSDGTYRRQRIADAANHPSPPTRKPTISIPAYETPKKEPQQCETPQPQPCPEPASKVGKANSRTSCAAKHPSPPFSIQESNIGSFLHQLLPKDFDTGDLLIVLLLILMAGDCSEDRNTALLTLMLYFFM